MIIITSFYAVHLLAGNVLRFLHLHWIVNLRVENAKHIVNVENRIADRRGVLVLYVGIAVVEFEAVFGVAEAGVRDADRAHAGPIYVVFLCVIYILYYIQYSTVLCVRNGTAY